MRRLHRRTLTVDPPMADVPLLVIPCLLETLPRAAKVTTLAVTPSGASTGGTTISTSNLQLQVTVEFYTTDVSAGPGSIPGPSESIGTGA